MKKPKVTIQDLLRKEGKGQMGSLKPLHILRVTLADVTLTVPETHATIEAWLHTETGE